MRKILMLMLSAGMLVFYWGASGFAVMDHNDYEHRCSGECLRLGWSKVFVKVAGYNRQLLWKGPSGPWKNGAMIVLHGGGGSWTNWCSGLPMEKPMMDFAAQAIARGFAVFALDSTDGVVMDASGNPAGKRFDCIARDGRPNIDLPFIEYVITTVIPKLRSKESAADVFIAGISTGGFMAILAATTLDDKITAFAIVSAGDPYGTYIDQPKGPGLRKKAPGFFYDNETHKNIAEENAAAMDIYLHEMPWHTSLKPDAKKPFFKQFHNLGDSVVDISCMKKAQSLLIKNGYRNGGPFIIQDTGGKKLYKHFWMNEYNEPMINFFIDCRTRDKKEEGDGRTNKSDRLSRPASR